MNWTTSVVISDDEEVPMEAMWEYKLYEILKITTIVVAVFGVLGNALAYLTANRIRPIGSSVTLMKVLAITDTLSVVHDGFVTFGLPMVFDYDLLSSSRWVCKLFLWHGWASTVGSSAVVVLFTMDRLIAVWFPIFYKNHFSAKRAWRVGMAVFVSYYVQFVPVAHFYDVMDGKCVLANSLEYFGMFMNYALWGMFIIGPTICLFTMNVAILWKLNDRRMKKQAAKAAAASNTSSNAARKEDAHDKGLTVLLLTVSTVYLILTVSTGSIFYYSLGIAVVDNKTDALAKMLGVALELPCSLNNSLNFYLYCLSGKSFRNKFLEMIGLGGTAKPVTSQSAKAANQ